MSGTNADAGSDPVDDAREEVVEAMARAAEVWGIKGSYGRMFGVLYFAEEPVSLDDLAERTGYAKSTVSTAMSAMERFHLVHRRSVPGEGKRAFYEAETDVWHVVQQFLNQEARSELRIMRRALDDAAAQLDDLDSPEAVRLREKIEDLRALYDHAETFIDVLTSAPLERVLELFANLRSNS